jgi:hypothetical protein
MLQFVINKKSWSIYPLEWTTLIGLMREGATFLNCRLSFPIWYTMCLAGNIVLFSNPLFGKKRPLVFFPDDGEEYEGGLH